MSLENFIPPVPTGLVPNPAFPCFSTAVGDTIQIQPNSSFNGRAIGSVIRKVTSSTLFIDRIGPGMYVAISPAASG